MNKSASVGAVRCRPYGHRLGGGGGGESGNRQTDLDRGCGTSRSLVNPLQPLLAVVPEYLEGTDLWTTREPRRSPGFLKRDSSTSLQQKKKSNEFGRIRQGKWNFDSTAPPSRWHSMIELAHLDLSSGGGKRSW